MADEFTVTCPEHGETKRWQIENRRPEEGGRVERLRCGCERPAAQAVFPQDVS